MNSLVVNHGGHSLQTTRLGLDKAGDHVKDITYHRIIVKDHGICGDLGLITFVVLDHISCRQDVPHFSRMVLFGSHLVVAFKYAIIVMPVI